MRRVDNTGALNQRKRFDDLQIKHHVVGQSDMPALSAIPKPQQQNLPPLKGQRHQGPISDPHFLNNKGSKSNQMHNLNHQQEQTNLNTNDLD